VRDLVPRARHRPQGAPMSAKALFLPGAGDSYTPVNDRIALLPKGKRSIALACWNAIIDELPLGETEVWITDWRLSKSRWLKGYSLRTIQKGLLALSPYAPKDRDGNGGNEDGIGLIDRERRKGRRKIIVLSRLRGRPASGQKSKQKPVDARTIPIARATPTAAAAVPEREPEPPAEFDPEVEAVREKIMADAKAANQKLREAGITDPHAVTVAVTRGFDAEIARRKPPSSGP
jgi:hypothetical protein